MAPHNCVALSHPMAQRLGYDPALLAEVAGALARAVMHEMRWAVNERHDLGSVEPLHAGVFMVVQRFRGDLGLYVHLHALATDGAFEEEGGAVRVLAAPTPTAERMTAVLAHVHKVLAAVDADDDLDMDPALRACVQLALAGPHLVPPPASAAPPLTVSALGMHLDAATTVDGRDRKQLERVSRYMLRSPFAHDAVQAVPDGRVRVHFKAPWRSGAAHADMTAEKFLARLCALVPPPGFHMTRYFGVLASRHHLRPRILPPSVVPASGQQLALALADDDDSRGPAAESSARPRRIGRARLLARVFAVDVTVSRKCGGRMRVLDVVTGHGDIARFLHGARAPPRPPRPTLLASSGCSQPDRAPSATVPAACWTCRALLLLSPSPSANCSWRIHPPPQLLPMPPVPTAPTRRVLVPRGSPRTPPVGQIPAWNFLCARRRARSFGRGGSAASIGPSTSH